MDVTTETTLKSTGKNAAVALDARKYERASGHQYAWGLQLVQTLSLRGDERILDLCCGNGAVTAKLAERVPNGSVLGIDRSRNMTDFAADTYGNDRLQFEKMDILTMDFENEFDVIFSNAALHWIKKHNHLIEHCHRALKPGGFVRFNFAADGNSKRLLEAVRGVMMEDSYAQYFVDFEWPWYMPNLNSYEMLWEDSDFNNYKIWTEDIEWQWKNIEAMSRWIDQPSLVPFMQAIDEDEAKISFRYAVLQRMIVQAIDPLTGSCSEDFVRMNVHAQK